MDHISDGDGGGGASCRDCVSDGGVEPAAWAVSVMVMVGVEEETAASEMAEIVGTVVAGELVASGRVVAIVVVVAGTVAATAEGA